MRKDPDVIVPISLELDNPTKREIVTSILEQKEKFSIKKFLLAGPGAGHRSKKYPKAEVFVRLAKLFADVKDELKGKDITLGWWDTLTIKSGASTEFTPIVKADGSTHPFANCPLDENFKKCFSENVALFAEIAKPAFTVFEDDYSVCAAAGGYGCMCSLHLNEFAKREGKYYTREDLLEIFKTSDEEALSLRRRYRALMKDSLVELSNAVRSEVDKKNPEINIGLCQSGYSDIDADSTEAVCRALSGKNHTPFCRFYGAYYCGGDAKGIPERIYHAIYNREHIKGDLKFLHEADSFPHTRFFSSAKQMKAFMGIAYSSGFVGSLFQTQQLLDDPNEEKAYGEMYLEEKKRFGELISSVENCERIGVSLPYDPFWNTVDDEVPEPFWTRTLDLFGVPYTTRAANITFIDKRTARYASDKEILGYLEKTVFIDGDAAYELDKRGFSEYIGVRVGEDIATDKIGYDLGAREILKAPFDNFSRGKNMPIAHMFANGGNGILRWLTPCNRSTEIISEAYTFDKEHLTVAMTRFINELGGKVIVMGMTVSGNTSQSLFNYRRKRLFEELIIWADPNIPLVRDDPNIHLIVNKNSSDEHHSHIFTLINLGDDTVNSVTLHIPEILRTAKIYCLNKEGLWSEVIASENEKGLQIPCSLELCEPLYLKFQ